MATKANRGPRGIQAPELTPAQIPVDTRQRRPEAFADVIGGQIGAFRAELDAIVEDIHLHRVLSEDDQLLGKVRDLALQLKHPVGDQPDAEEVAKVLTERDALQRDRSEVALPRHRWQEALFRFARRFNTKKLDARTAALNGTLSGDFEATLVAGERHYPEEFAQIQADMSAYRRGALQHVAPLAVAFNGYFPNVTKELRELNKLRVEYKLAQHLLRKREDNPFRGQVVSDARIQEVLELEDDELQALKTADSGSIWTDIQAVFSRMRDDLHREIGQLSINRVELRTVVSGILRGTILPRNQQDTDRVLRSFREQSAVEEVIVRDGLLQERDFFGERLKGEEGNARVQLSQYLAAKKASKTANDNLTAQRAARDERNRKLNEQDARITNTNADDDESFAHHFREKLNERDGDFWKVYVKPERDARAETERSEQRAAELEDQHEGARELHDRQDPGEDYADDERAQLRLEEQVRQNLIKDLKAGVMADPKDPSRSIRIDGDLNKKLLANLKGYATEPCQEHPQGVHLSRAEHQAVIDGLKDGFEGSYRIDGKTYIIHRLGREAAMILLRQVYKQQFKDEVIAPAKQAILDHDSYRNVDRDIAACEREVAKAQVALEITERRSLLFGYLLQHLAILSQTVGGVYSLLRGTLDDANGLLAGEAKERLLGYEDLRSRQNGHLARAADGIKATAKQEVTKLDGVEVLMKILTDGEGILCEPAEAKRIAYRNRIEDAEDDAALNALNAEAAALPDEQLPQRYKQEIDREVRAKKMVLADIAGKLGVIRGAADVATVQARVQEALLEVARGKHYAGQLSKVVDAAKTKTSELTKAEFDAEITANAGDEGELRRIAQELRGRREDLSDVDYRAVAENIRGRISAIKRAEYLAEVTAVDVTDDDAAAQLSGIAARVKQDKVLTSADKTAINAEIATKRGRI